MDLHPITAESFALIDSEIGHHNWTEPEYAIVRRAIHATADFELSHLFWFSATAISRGVRALRANMPVVVDVQMVAVAIRSTLQRAGYALPYTAIEAAPRQTNGRQTRTEAGMQHLARQYPQAVFVVGNAPTALHRLVDDIAAERIWPSLVIGCPVGFVNVEASKAALLSVDVPSIVVRGRKGGSPVAAAIVNALVHLSIDNSSLAELSY